MFEIGDEVSFIVHDDDGDEEMATGTVIRTNGNTLAVSTIWWGNLFVSANNAFPIDNSPCCIAFVTSGGSDHVPDCEND